MERLTAAKFTTIRDLEGLGPVELSRECPSLTREDALYILTTIQTDLNDRNEAPTSSTSSSLGVESSETSQEVNFTERTNNVFTSAKSALEKLQEAANLPPIVTFCQSLDNALGGGVPLGRLTEFCGLPGVGKTQLGTQLAINTYIPAYFGGCEGRSIYIDTEGSFVPTRAMNLVQGLVNHMDRLSSDDPEAPKLTEKSITSNLHFYRVHNYIEQLALIGQLKEIVNKLNSTASDAALAAGGDPNDPRNKIRCIVIDSITFHFRAADQFSDLSGRNRLLSKMASELTDIATSLQIAVIVMNQMTTKPGVGVVPALGDVWGHHPSTRVVLEADAIENKRKAILIKSSSRPFATAFYQITSDGVRDCDS
jgi:RAD51-like protein 2